MMRLIPHATAFSLLVQGIALYGQDAQHAAETSAAIPDTMVRKNSAMVTFDRNLNTYNWVGRLVVDTAYGGSSIRLLQNYNANIIRLGAGGGEKGKLASNQENIGLVLGQKVNNSLGLQFQWNSLVYSDDKAVGLSNASGHSLLGGVDVTPFPFLTITPLLGYRWDNQGDIRERGISYTLAGRLAGLDMDGYRIVGNGQIHEDRLDPRSLADHTGRVGIQKWFSDQTRDSVEFGYARLKREFYALADSNIESRVENLVAFSNLLDYEVDRGLLTSLFVSVTSRGFDKDLRRTALSPAPATQFDTRIDEFRFDTYLQAQYRSADGTTTGQVRLGYAERDESHAAKPPGEISPTVSILFNERNRQEQSKDNIARKTSLSGLLAFPLSSSDQITISGGAGILRYDTPSSLNVEDRDELLVAASVGSTHHVTSSVELGLLLEGTLGHLVYLLKERSANNNINRVLRFAPRVVFRPSDMLVTTNSFEVLANYTVYDFEQDVALAKSFSYRQFAWVDSTAFRLTRRVGVHFYSYIKLYERGQLKWHEFRERTENSLADQTYALQLRFNPTEETLFAVGMQYFSQSRYNYNQGDRRRASFQRSIGPTCVVRRDLGSRGQINFRGWYEHRSQPDGTDRAIASMTLTILLNF
jgi:hypothetical protein